MDDGTPLEVAAVVVPVQVVLVLVHSGGHGGTGLQSINIS